MNRVAVTALLGGAVILSSAVLMAGTTSGWIVGLAGFFFVIGGTLLTAVVSENYGRVEKVLRAIPAVFRVEHNQLDDKAVFMRVAELYRQGRVRQAEMTLKSVADPFLRQGAQLIIDNCSRDELDRTLLWQLSNTKEVETQRLRILYAMASFAPAFGMLGTLMGLVRMLFSLGDEGLAIVGASMGFAMITTVYGLVSANLIIKPVAIKMERRSRERLAWQNVKYELLIMLFEKEHPTIMNESLSAFIGGHLSVQREAAAVPATPGLARA